jgi:hypothetical protein
MKQYRLASGNMVSAPGMVRWAINFAVFKKDEPQMVRVIARGWNLPEDVARKLVTKQVAYTIEDETVVFEA